MTRIRTHNQRAKRLPYLVYKRRMRKARKIARFAAMYGAGPRKMQEALKDFGYAAQNAATKLSRHWGFFDRYSCEEHGDPVLNTVTGRMVCPGPNFNYQTPECDAVRVAIPNYLMQQEEALLRHWDMLDEARARGDIVIEHSYADATIFPKGS